MASSTTRFFVAMGIAILLGGCAGTGLVVSDKDKERRWAEQIVPNLVVGQAIYLPTVDDNGKRDFLALYTPVNVRTARGAVILIHGKGVHPDYGIIGALRVELPSHGYTTLSLQMPVLRNDASDDDYYFVFHDAGTRILAAVELLRAQGYSRVYLLSHSMGGRMAEYYLERAIETKVSAWVSLSIASGEYEHAQSMRLPILDIYAESDLPRVLNGAGFRRAVLQGISGSRQVQIRGADHFFTGHEKEVVNDVVRYLDNVR